MEAPTQYTLTDEVESKVFQVGEVDLLYCAGFIYWDKEDNMFHLAPGKSWYHIREALKHVN